MVAVNNRAQLLADRLADLALSVSHRLRAVAYVSAEPDAGGVLRWSCVIRVRDGRCGERERGMLPGFNGEEVGCAMIMAASSLDLLTTEEQAIYDEVVEFTRRQL
jgi:hypothetical protein